MRDRFSSQVLDLHRRVVGPRTAAGRLQVPWPRAIGTPPWAVASQLSWTAARQRLPVRYTLHTAWWRRDRAFRRVAGAAAGDRPVVLYVGNRWLPRHVVLVASGTDDALWCYEPAAGSLREVTRAQFVERRLDLASWDRPWFTVMPTGRRASSSATRGHRRRPRLRPPGRRTRA